MKTKFYNYNKNTLQFNEVKWVRKFLKFITVMVVLSIIVITNSGLTNKTPITQLTEEELIIINRNYDEFTPEKLEAELKNRNLKFPHIIYAQSILETGSWTSRIFNENHNLFGMKEAKSRPTTALGTQYNHAYYGDWKKSVEDYVIYYGTYLHKEIRTEDDFFTVLEKKGYAEASNYIGALKIIIEEHDLKTKFNIN